MGRQAVLSCRSVTPKCAVALFVLSVSVAPSGAQDAGGVATLLNGLAAHFEKVQHVSGRLLVNTYYSPEAIQWAELRDSTRVFREQHPEMEPRWSDRGVVYCDFWIDGPRWAARAARVINSGFGEFGLPGIFEADPSAAWRPPARTTPPGVCEYCDDELLFRYQPHLGVGYLYSRPDPEGSYLRAHVLTQLLEMRGAPLAGHILSRPGDREGAEVLCVIGRPGDPSTVYRISYRTGDDGNCRATYWIECRGSDSHVIKYDDYWLRGDGVGYRQVAETREVTELGNGACMASEVVTWRFEYYPAEQHAWHSTTVATLLDVDSHLPGMPQWKPWEWLPLGTHLDDPGHRLGDHQSYDPTYLVGDLRRLWDLARDRYGHPAPFDPAMDAPIDDAAVSAQKGPVDLTVQQPALRQGP